jgi:hypothetical protein
MQPRIAIADIYFPPTEHIYIMILKGELSRKKGEKDRRTAILITDRIK